MTVGGVLFDIDGVLVTSWEPIDGAAQALRALESDDVRRCFLTNTTSRTRVQIAELLTAAGLAVPADEVITAAMLTADHVIAQHPGARCYLLNDGDITADMPGVDFVESLSEDPDVIILGGAGPQFDHVALSRVYELMAQGVPIVAMHRNAVWSTREGLRVDTGVYLAGMEQVSGRKAVAVGKPAPAGFQLAAERMGCEPDQVVMVGDDLHVDVLAAQVVGMTGVLVRTGKFRQDILDRWAADQYAMQPAYVIDSIADLPDLLSALP
ncbi:HAD family hydrolase [Mycobacteroides immunogenum]|uniref:HAD family hydrolase n=1 Tax=Mycobacteroides immunogenum TaxID=83262 RepID=A0A179VC42_9MYCO|nr:HAD-IIA family hydrolase [Mycobacteroides immunogenum]OAT68545.1 HAD family hydrolase [Mycobacteroides immunogenum]